MMTMARSVVGIMRAAHGPKAMVEPLNAVSISMPIRLLTDPAMVPQPPIPAAKGMPIIMHLPKLVMPAPESSWALQMPNAIAAIVVHAATFDMIEESKHAANMKNRMMMRLLPREIFAANAATRLGMVVRLRATVMAMVPMQNAIKPTLIPLAASLMDAKPPENTIKNVNMTEAMPKGINPDSELAKKRRT